MIEFFKNLFKKDDFKPAYVYDEDFRFEGRIEPWYKALYRDLIN